MRRYVRLPGSVDDAFLMIDETLPAGDRERWAHANRLGSTIAVTDKNGAVKDRFRYSAFGVEGPEGPGGFPFRFTGQKLDPETGLYYYKARYYDPETGRFLQADPIGYEDQMNLYAYVGNDPLNWKDPDGQVATVTFDEESKRVEIEVKVLYSGSGTTDTNKQAVSQAIQDTFTGQFDGFEVTTTVTEVSERGDDVNEIEIIDGYGRSSVRDNQYMTLYTRNPQSTFHRTSAHEGGHLLGLPDRYHVGFVPKPWSPSGGQYEGVSDPGYQGNIMGAEGYGVKGSQIERIIRAESNLVTRK